jgi:hypothetical protein
VTCTNTGSDEDGEKNLAMADTDRNQRAYVTGEERADEEI